MWTTSQTLRFSADNSDIAYGTDVTSARQSTCYHKRSVENCDRRKNTDHFGKKIPTLIGSKRGSLIEKVGQFSGKPKKLYIVWRTIITLTKLLACLLKYDFPVYRSS